ncbi:hypothetical protein NLM27_05245 [Bradyrhizobium sp. CCGB12]|nr:hypothetical protein [Bradyrhizobium sp. CCGB12]MCP3388183.1 hypothetical protein [Bradyrhizobium sp. CCGB12]
MSRYPLALLLIASQAAAQIKMTTAGHPDPAGDGPRPLREAVGSAL